MGVSVAAVDLLPPVSLTLWGPGDRLAPPGAWEMSWNMSLCMQPQPCSQPEGNVCAQSCCLPHFSPSEVGGAHVFGVGLEKMLLSSPLPPELLGGLSLSYI